LIPRENNESKVDAPPNSLMDSTANPKVKTTKGKGVGGACWSFRMGIRKNDKWVNYSHESIQTKQ
jgi:hypothetical protein